MLRYICVLLLIWMLSSWSNIVQQKSWISYGFIRIPLYWWHTALEKHWETTTPIQSWEGQFWVKNWRVKSKRPLPILPLYSSLKIVLQLFLNETKRCSGHFFRAKYGSSYPQCPHPVDLDVVQLLLPLQDVLHAVDPDVDVSYQNRLPHVLDQAAKRHVQALEQLLDGTHVLLVI